MANIANLVVYDPAGIAHTFIPVEITRTPGRIEALYRENTTGVTLDAQSTVTVRVIDSPKSKVKTVEVETAVPVMEAITNQNAAGYTAAPSVAFVLRAKTQFFWHPRTRENERSFLRQLQANLIQGTVANVTSITTGAIPDVVDRLYAPT